MTMNMTIKWPQFHYRYGVTDIHISDNGTEFINAIAQELYKAS